jgi:predicted NAD-dependent protein-ADP-ribosyltransferase YbiA (DUF1768 family)
MAEINVRELYTKDGRRLLCFKFGPLSTFDPSPFALNGYNFLNAEMAYQFFKCDIMKNTDLAATIMASKSPHVHKILGKFIENFDAELWKSVCVPLMYEIQKTKVGSVGCGVDD